MSEKADGGPAFPPQDRVLVLESHEPEVLRSIADAFAHDRMQGMTLRDWFAGQALLIAELLIAEMSGYTPEWTAKRAYELADAMLKERDGG